MMTYLDRYGSYEAYQKERAIRTIACLQEGRYYSEALGKVVNVFERPEYLMNEDEKREKRKILADISRLQTYVSGAAINPNWVMQWNYLKDSEYPSWRDGNA